MKPDLDTSHLGPERKGTPTDVTPVHAYSPTEEFTRYRAPPKGNLMFPNVKLQHWAFVAFGLASIIVSWLMDQSAHGTLVLPATVITVLTVIRTVLGLLSPSVSPTTNLKAVESHRIAVAEEAVRP